MPFSSSRARQPGRVGSVWVVAARVALGVSLGALAGVTAPFASSVFASPAHGSAAAESGHGEGHTGVHSGNAGASASSEVSASRHASKSRSGSQSSGQVQAASASSALTLSGNSVPPGQAKKSNGGGGVHAASVESDNGTGAVTIPGNCQSPQCQAVQQTISALAGSPPTSTPAQPPASVSNTLVPATAGRSPRLAVSHAVRTRAGGTTPTTTTTVAGAPPAHEPSVLDEPVQLATAGWQGVSLQAASNLRIPILFGAAVLLFVLLQALVDRRDPKMSRAPERGDDDTVGFS